MSQKEFEKQRPLVLAQARGVVLEIGSGSGLNFKYYPATASKVYALDPNPGMQKLARKNAQTARLPIELVTQNGEQLPYENETFDTVVSTWTLCSIEGIEKALGEIRRVLKPRGRFVFIEHGLSPDARTCAWQRRLTPLQKKLAGNCHLDRAIRDIIENQAFRLDELNEYYIEKIPKLVGYTYQGIARPA